MFDRFLEWSFQQKANLLFKRSKEMNMENVTNEQWNNLTQVEKANHDPVNPSHYKKGKFECIEYIKQQLGSEFPSYLEGSAIKYIHRFKFKNNIEDLEKAQWYINKLIEHYENL